MNPNVQRIDPQQKILDFQQREYVHNNYPTSTYSHKQRHNLDIVEIGRRKAQGTLRRESICMICEEGASAEKELYTCDGRISGEMKNEWVMEAEERTCNSQFHLDCIMEYNASGFDFAYAARIECQRKFLCPLHCCSVCNKENKKQSAYESKLIECAYCFRAFHVDCCYPAGSEKLEVTIGYHTFKMTKCPHHSDPAPVLQHIPNCCSPDCEGDTELQKCRKCIRSFHSKCRKVEQLNGENAPEDLCDSCLREDVILVRSPVIALHPDTNKFRMGKTQAADQMGRMRTKWLKNSRRDGYSLVPNSHVAEVRESYLHLAEGNQKSYWETTFDDYKEVHIQRYPPVFKTVFRTVKKSRYAKGNQMSMPTEESENFCKCGKYANCEEGSCENAYRGQECPPSCSEKKELGYVCNNRKIATGFVNSKIRMKKAGKKGYGIFANERIEEGEFLAAFHGEICDKEEYERRNAVKKGSKDSQCINQFMDLCNGFTMDMSNYGNISRYANNSCKNPNAKAQLKLVYARKRSEKLRYEPRCYLKASKAIEKGAEVTISYGFSGTSCFCDTCREETDEPEWNDDSDKENAKPSGAAKRKATSEANIPSAKAFKSSQ